MCKLALYRYGEANSRFMQLRNAPKTMKKKNSSVQYSSVSGRALLCLKVPRNRPFVLLVGSIKKKVGIVAYIGEMIPQYSKKCLYQCDFVHPLIYNLCKDCPHCTANTTQSVSIWKTNQLALYGERIVVHCKVYRGRTAYVRCMDKVQWTLELRPVWHTKHLGYEQNFSFDLRPKSWVTTRMPVKATWVTTRKAFVSFSLSPDTRVCGRNSGQCSALYN
jgi:hypothetical protein